MDCNRVLTLINHLSELSSEEQHKIQRHIKGCFACRKAYQDFQKLEEVLSDYFAFPGPSSDLTFLQSLPTPKIQAPHRVTFLFAISVFVSLLCVLLLSPQFDPTPKPITSESSIALAPKTFIYTTSLWVPGNTNPLVIALEQFGATPNQPTASAFLTHTETNTIYPIFESVAIQEGILRNPVQLPPNIPTGDYHLKIVTVSAKDQQPREYHSQIKVAPTLKLFLQTDKPRYQNAQEIHLHSLLINPQKQPIAFKNLSPIRFTIQDPKGNPIFYKEVPLNDYGSAWTSFQLADEVSFGEYEIIAEFEEQSVQTQVLVDRYELPKMLIQLNTNRDYHALGDIIDIETKVNYPYGKPVANAKLFFGLIHESGYQPRIKIFTQEHQTNTEGICKLSIPPLSSEMLGKFYLEVTAIDDAQQTAYQTKVIHLAESPYTVHCVPEGGSLRLGLENKLFCITTLPDGKPVQTKITFYDGPRPVEITTPESGVAEWIFSPQPTHIRKENNQEIYELSYKIASEKNESERRLKIPIQTQTEQLLVTLDKAIYEAGDAFVAQILGSTPISSVFLTLSQNGILLAQQEIPSHFDSRKTLEWNSTVPPGTSGNLLLTATQLLPSGKWIEDSRVFFVKPNHIKIQIEKKPNQSLHPKEPLDLVFRASEKNPLTQETQSIASGILAVSIVDESVFAFPAKNLAQLYYALENRLRQNKVSVLNDKVVEDYLDEATLEKAQQNTAKALYATLEPQSHFVQFGDPFKTPEEQQLLEQLLAKNLLPYLLDHPFMIHSENQSPQIDPRLFSQMILKLNLPLNPFLAEKTILLEKLLKHPAVDPAIQKVSLKKLPKIVSQLRYMSLKELAKQTSSSQEFKQLLREKNIPEERMFTAQGEEHSFTFQAKKSRDFLAQSGTIETSTQDEESPIPTKPEAPISKNPTESAQKTPEISMLEKAIKKIFGQNSDSIKTESTATNTTNEPEESPKKQNESLGKGAGAGTNERRSSDKNKTESKNFSFEGQKALNDFPFDPNLSQRPNESQQYEKREESESEEGSPSERLKKLSAGHLSNKEIEILLDEKLKNARKDQKQTGQTKTGVKSRETDTSKNNQELPPRNPESRPDQGEEAKDSEEDNDNGEAETDSKTSQESVENNIKKTLPLELEKIIKFRKYFPETLLFKPDVLIQNGEGRLRIENVPDSMTTFRVDATLSTTEGSVGREKSQFEIFQPFFVDLNVPPFFTVYDEARIPLILHNYSKKELNVILRVNKEDWFKLLSQEDSWTEEENRFARSYSIPPQKVHMVEFPIRILQAGSKTITVSATANQENLTDGMTKNILVVPEGQKKVHGTNYLLTNSGALHWNLPQQAKLEDIQVFLQVYPDLLSHLRNASIDVDSVILGGLEDIFNQGFPVLFLYEALKAEKRLTLEEEIQTSYIYQRLLSYQSEHGFSRFRKEPPNILYTTLGLWMLNKMKPFQSWHSSQKESALMARCKQKILDQYRSEQKFLPFLSTFPITNNEEDLLAFVYWILRETNVPPSQLTEIKEAVHNRFSIENPLSKALHYLAQSKDGDVNREDLENLQSTILAEDLAIRALRVIALQGNYAKVTEDIRSLLENKQSQGGWNSLFLNLFATQALVTYHQQQQQKPTTIQVQIEKELKTLEPGLVYTFPLSLQGENSSWMIQTSYPLFCQLLTSYYVPIENKFSAETETSLKVEYHPLDRPLEFPHWEASVCFTPPKETFKAPVVLEIGIPPGFTPANLEDLKRYDVEHYEQTARHILVYLRSKEGFIPPEINFSIRLRPQLRMKVQAPPSGYREMAFQGKSDQVFAKNKVDTLSAQ